MALKQLIPDVSVLLALSPEELAFQILKIFQSMNPAGNFRFDSLRTTSGTGMAATTQDLGYGQQDEYAVELAATEAWRWLEFNMFILPQPGINGGNGWYVLGRRGRAAMTEHQFADYRRASKFPRELIHPSIVDQVWNALARGEYSTAVFISFRAVEIAVRGAGKFADTDIGPNLMRKAFDAQNGPLTKLSDPTAEREALANLFAGAIGSYKNPHSHRTVTIEESGEAQEMVLLASHLLRIIDARRKAIGP